VPFGEFAAEFNKISVQKGLPAGNVDLACPAETVKAVNDCGDFLYAPEDGLISPAKTIGTIKIAEMAYMPVDFDVALHVQSPWAGAKPFVLLHGIAARTSPKIASKHLTSALEIRYVA
jgi:hypothetical protein